MKANSQWFVYNKKADFFGLAKKFNVDPVIIRVMRNREVIGDEEIRKYLTGDSSDFYDPHLLKDVEKLTDILIEKFEYETGLEICEEPEMLAIIGGISEGVKKQLSAQGMLSVRVSTSFPGYGKATISVTRKEFENNTADLIERTGALCQAVLEEANLQIRDVTDVLLVGGSTRMPQVVDYLQKMFHKRPLSHVNPDEAVAIGAAIQSSKQNESYASLSVQVVNGKKKTDRHISGLSSSVTVRAEKKLNSLGMLSLRETTAHAMGIIAINDEGNRYYNEIIIPANHPRPVRAAKKFRFFTSANSNNELAVYVLQGDSENPLDCQITYKYVVTGIKHVNKGERIGTIIRIQYSYDENGVIHIQARQGSSNTDLPIRRETLPSDVSKFGKPVTKDEADQSFNLGSQLTAYETQDFVHKYRAIKTKKRLNFMATISVLWMKALFIQLMDLMSLKLNVTSILQR